MSLLLDIALANLLVAAVIALAAIAVQSWARRPALAHGLWLLCFVKLVTPPLIPVSFALPSSSEQAAWEPKAAPAPVELPEPLADMLFDLPEFLPAAIGQDNDLPPQGDALVPVGREVLPDEAEAPAPIPWWTIVAAVWAVGAVCWFLLAAARLVRFQRLLRYAQPAGAELDREARAVAAQMNTSCPSIWVMPGQCSPMLWVWGLAPRLLLPGELLERLDATQRRALLAHELAHWRRGDHWARRLELLVLGLYWWCPVVWRARRQLQQAEEDCCDAWVVWLMPDAARGYALALVETVEFLSQARPQLPPIASGIGHVRLMKRRLTMIMRGTTPRALTVGGVLALIAVGVLLLPLVPTWAQQPGGQRQGGQQQGGQQQGGQQGEEQQDPPRQGKGKGKGKGVGGDQKGPANPDLEKARQDIRRAQEELEHARQELDRRSRQLHEMMEHLKQAEQTAAKGPPLGDKQGKGGKKGFGEFGPGGPPVANMDKRLQEVERKLDVLIQMMSQQKKGPGFSGGFGGGGFRPGGPGGPGGGPGGAPGGPGAGPRDPNNPMGPQGPKGPPNP